MNDGFIPPSEWGPKTWDHLYTIGGGLDLTRRAAYKAYFELVPYILRCDECNLNAQAIWARRPIDPYLSSREKLLEWIWLQHMDVRKHQKVKTIPDFPLSDVYKRYLPADAQPEVTAAAIDDNSLHGRGAAEGFAVRPAWAEPAQAPVNTAISLFAAPAAHSGAGGYPPGPPPATMFVPVASPSQYPAAASAIPFSVFAGGFTSDAPRVTTAQSVDGQVKSQVAAAGYKNLPASAIGVSRCCKSRMQASGATTQAFVV
jgi:hypothetical protein